MESSILLAKIISIIYMSTGIALLVGTINFDKIVDDIEKSPALIFISGCLGIIIGTILIEYHNLWIKNWNVIITIISWAFLIGGVTVVMFPKSLSFFHKDFRKKSRLMGIVMIIFGAFMGYFGFIV